MRLMILAGICAGLSGAWKEVSTDVEVDTPRGRLRGRHVNFGNDTTDFYYGEADVFLGIPYVQPPERFKRPVPTCQYAANGETFVAQQYGPACYQAGSGCPDGSDVPMSEDCLSLNVFTPNVSSNYKYPVMVFIHGGGLMYGCAAEYPYDGAVTNLVNRGVVVVTFQYRLSTLGFFTTGTEDFPQNLGMLDQVEALKWVKDQIAHFGGDPNRITLFGQSAGGVSVSAHTYSPLSQDLFQQAIMESGVALMLFEGSLGNDDLCKHRAQELCKVSAHDFDAGKFEKLKECFDKMDPKDLVKLDTVNIVGWKIVPGDDFMPDIPHNLAPFRNNIPVMIGSMKDEWTYYDMMLMSRQLTKLETYTRKFFEVEFDILGGFLGDRKLDMLHILENVYAGVAAPDDDHELWLRATSAAFTSAGFTSFIQRDFADYLANGNTRMWLYELTYPKVIGKLYDLPGFPEAVPHSSENAYLWRAKREFDQAIATGYVNQDDYALADWFGTTWTNFAKYGRPYLSDDWPNIPATGPEIYMDISGPRPAVNRGGYMIRDNLVWNQVLVALHGDFIPAQFNTSSVSREDFDRIKASYSPDSDMCANNDATGAPRTTTVRTTLPSTVPSSTADSISSTMTLVPSSTSDYISWTLSSFSTTSSSSLLLGWRANAFILLSLLL